MGSYLHQDWANEFASLGVAIQAFIEGEPADVVEGAHRDVVEALSIVATVDDPDAFLAATLMCDYRPAGDGMTVSQWLDRVRIQLMRA
jgi:hypothetical protein